MGKGASRTGSGTHYFLRFCIRFNALWKKWGVWNSAQWEMDGGYLIHDGRYWQGVQLK